MFVKNFGVGGGGEGGGGSLTATYVGYGSDTDELTGDENFTYSEGILAVPAVFTSVVFAETAQIDDIESSSISVAGTAEIGTITGLAQIGDNSAGLLINTRGLNVAVPAHTDTDPKFLYVYQDGAGQVNGITAGANNPLVHFNFGSIGWTSGSTVPTQYFVYMQAPTVVLTGANMTNAFTLYVEPPTGGSITNAWAAGFGGNVRAEGVFVPNGAGATPTYAYYNAPTTGLYYGGSNANAHSFSIAGFVRGRIGYSNSTLGIQFFAATSGEPATIKGNQSAGTGAVADVYAASTNTRTAGFIFAVRNNTTDTATIAYHGGIATTSIAQSSGTPYLLQLTGANHTGITNGEFSTVDINPGTTLTFANGNFATERLVRIRSTAIAFTSGSNTITAAYGFYVDAPTQGANCTLTAVYAAGFGGNVYVTGNLTSAQNITADWNLQALGDLYVGNRAYINAPATAPSDGDISNGRFSVWNDEGSNLLTFRVRDSAGNLQTGTIALA